MHAQSANRVLRRSHSRSRPVSLHLQFWKRSGAQVYRIIHFLSYVKIREHNVDKYRMDKYRIKHKGSRFAVTFDAGETVGVYGTAKEARQTINDCEQRDLIFKTARTLVKKAVDGLMGTYNIDRQTAQEWIKDAAG